MEIRDRLGGGGKGKKNYENDNSISNKIFKLKLIFTISLHPLLYLFLQ